MNIALFGTYNEDDTGPSRVTEGLAKGLTNLGATVDIYCHGDKTTAPHGIGVYHLGPTPQSVSGFVRYMRRATRLASNRGYDVFHPLEEFHWPTSVRTVQWTSGVYERKKRAPRDFGGYKSLLGDLALNAAARASATFSSEVVASSPETARQMRRYWRLEPDRIIPLGIDSEWFSEPSDVDCPLDVLLVGRLTQKKGQRDVLRYLDPGADEYNVTIAGSAADSEYHEQMARWHDAMLGFVERPRLETLYERHDVVVVPSRHENFSLVALEAIAKGCILVITEMCGFAQFDEVQQNDGVVVVDSGRGAAKAVKHLSTDVSVENTEYSKAAAFNLARQFKWEMVAAEYLEVYKNANHE